MKQEKFYSFDSVKTAVAPPPPDFLAAWLTPSKHEGKSRGATALALSGTGPGTTVQVPPAHLTEPSAAPGGG